MGMTSNKGVGGEAVSRAFVPPCNRQGRWKPLGPGIPVKRSEP